MQLLCQLEHVLLLVLMILSWLLLMPSQVHADFEYIGQAANLTTLCVYGGTPYNTQEMVLRRVSVSCAGPAPVASLFLQRTAQQQGQFAAHQPSECPDPLQLDHGPGPG
jgi:hypothetical protein